MQAEENIFNYTQEELDKILHSNLENTTKTKEIISEKELNDLIQDYQDKEFEDKINE